MNHPKTVQITIPHPCSQNWDEMTPAQQGRFCAHCQKTVIDFSTWSDTALYNFFSKDQGYVCGRFLSTQVDRKIAIPYQPHSRLYRIAVAMGLTLMFTQTPELFAQDRPPKTEQVSVLKQAEPTNTQQSAVSGRVLDEKKEGLVNVAIRIYYGGVLKGETVTDYDGNYVIKPLRPGNYEVIATYPGYKEVKYTQVPVANSMTTTLNFNFEKKQNNDSAAVIKTYTRPLINGKAIRILGGPDIEVLPTTIVADSFLRDKNAYQNRKINNTSKAEKKRKK